jgi:hypothetical protein
MQPKELRWFRSLKPNPDKPRQALLEHYDPRANSSIRIISRENDFGVYEYAAADHHVHLFKYILSKTDEERCFHEKPLGGLPQKPRFDIDIKRKDLPSGEDDLMIFGSALRDKVIDNLILVLQDSGVKLSIEDNIRVYSSHREDKYSSHVIVTGYYHANCDDARGLYERVVADDEHLNKFVDRAVYDRDHSLRMLWCRKTAAGITKQQEKIFVYRGLQYTSLPGRTRPGNIEYNLLREFEESLIGFTSACRALPSYAIPKQHLDCDDLPENVCEEMFTMMNNTLPDAPFIITGVCGNLVKLKRIGPSFCEHCNKIHNSMTPFLFLSQKDNRIYMRCALAPKGKHTFLGVLKNEFVSELYNISYISDLVDEIESSGKIDIHEYESKIQSFQTVYSDIRNTPLFIEQKESAPFAVLGVTDPVVVVVEKEIGDVQRKNAAPVMRKSNTRKRLKIITDERTMKESEQRLMLKLSQQVKK